MQILSLIELVAPVDLPRLIVKQSAGQLVVSKPVDLVYFAPCSNHGDISIPWPASRGKSSRLHTRHSEILRFVDDHKSVIEHFDRGVIDQIATFCYSDISGS